MTGSLGRVSRQDGTGLRRHRCCGRDLIHVVVLRDLQVKYPRVVDLTDRLGVVDLRRHRRPVRVRGLAMVVMTMLAVR